MTTFSLAPNSLLFNLGIILLELAYSSSLRSQQNQCDLDAGQWTHYTEILIAKRLPGTVVREMGNGYSRIVKKLFHCDFGYGDDLSDPKLQGMIHRDVVCELERLERDFSNLHLD